MVGTVRIVLLGSGNVATNMALAMQKVGMNIIQVYSRTMLHARRLAACVAAAPVDVLRALSSDADLYLYALTDTALPDVVSQMPRVEGLHVHTAGSVPMNVFEGKQCNYGVLYPLQTFSRKKRVNMADVPLFLEANTTRNMQTLRQIAECVSHSVHCADFVQRQALHLAGVFANNFSNALCGIAQQLLAEHHLPFEVLLPLLHEQVEKLCTLAPVSAQTGPACRGDKTVINRQLQELQAHPEWQAIYRLMTKEIERQQTEEVKNKISIVL